MKTTYDFSLLELVGAYLRQCPDWISPEDVDTLCRETGVSSSYACALLMAGACGLDAAENPAHRRLFQDGFLPMIRILSPRKYAENPYCQMIRFPTAAQGSYCLARGSYRPYEAFVCGDLTEGKNHLLLPQIGFFQDLFSFPALFQGDQLWMSVTPNEVETMEIPLSHCRGHVLTYGLGMGYFAFMASQKPEVKSVTVVEKSPEVIELFSRYLLPQFPSGEKIHLCLQDALIFARTQAPQGRYDVIFADLWHDAGDGIPLYLALKQWESLCPHAHFDYWIEPSMALYLKGGWIADA